ncbi:MAG: response regulator [Gammaproteobacteria bacterium]
METTKKVRILHIEDNPIDAELIQLMLDRTGLNCEIFLVASRTECLTALNKGTYDLILSDSHGHDLDVLEILGLVRERLPDIPLLIVSGSFDDNSPETLKARGATDCLLKDNLDALATTIRRVLPAASTVPKP